MLVSAKVGLAHEGRGDTSTVAAAVDFRLGLLDCRGDASAVAAVEAPPDDDRGMRRWECSRNAPRLCARGAISRQSARPVFYLPCAELIIVLKAAVVVTMRLLLAPLSFALVYRPPLQASHSAAITRGAARLAVASPAELQPAPRPRAARAASLPLRIDGEWYELGDWAGEHPGGRWLLEYARGRDVTALFHAIHMRNEKLSYAALAKLPRLEASAVPLPTSPGMHPSQLHAEGQMQGEYVLSIGAPPDLPPLPPIDSALRSELSALLRREFPNAASSKATPAHWARTALAALGTAACWAGWLKGSALACLLLPFVHWVRQQGQSDPAAKGPSSAPLPPQGRRLAALGSSALPG